MLQGREPSAPSRVAAAAGVPPRVRAMNVAASLVHVAMGAYFLFVVPLWLWPKSAWWGLTLGLGALGALPMWAALHEKHPQVAPTLRSG